jgi:hypothetical protein
MEKSFPANDKKVRFFTSGTRKKQAIAMAGSPGSFQSHVPRISHTSKCIEDGKTLELIVHWPLNYREMIFIATLQAWKTSQKLHAFSYGSSELNLNIYTECCQKTEELIEAVCSLGKELSSKL